MDYAQLAQLMFPNTEHDVDYYFEKYRPRNLPEGAIVTRYAPSPTGFIHMGALYASFVARTFAKQTGGVFYLRIEDTDTKRTVDNGIQLIIDDLKKFGVVFDEGPVSQTEAVGDYGPYIQTQRKEIYDAFVKHLVAQGKAYPCFCTPEELDEIRTRQEESKEPIIGYWGKYAKYRDLDPAGAAARIEAGEPYVVRLKSFGDPNRKETFRDEIKGKLTVPENCLDIVIMKGDGFPTYHFAHFVDDTLMRTTHVIRGDEWIASLPIHLQLFRTFGVQPPKYAHIAPLMKTEDGSTRKLSKRKDPECAISYYFEIGMPTESILLYLATICNSDFEDWFMKNPGAKIEDFTFRFSHIGKSGAIYDLAKLYNISKGFVSRMKAQDLYDRSAPFLKEYDPEFYALYSRDEAYSVAALNIDREKPKPCKDIAVYGDIKAQIWYLYDELFQNPWQDKTIIDEAILADYFENVYDAADDSAAWMEKVKAFAPKHGYAADVKEYKKNPEGYKGHFGAICGMLRYLVTGQTNSPDLYSILHLLGGERVLARWEAYRKWAQ